jgi:O-antigen/teichoic acid export membrane protein
MFLIFGGLFYRSGAYVIGLVFFGMVGLAVLAAFVYRAEWFQNLDSGLRIESSILSVSLVGAVSGFFVDAAEGALFGWTYSLLFGGVVGALCALYLKGREDREMREYEREMRKYGREP